MSVTKINGHANVEWAALPKELRSEGRFCLYRNQPNGDGKPRKVPFDAKAPNRPAKSNDPATWSDFETAKKSFERYPFDGINAVCNLPFVFVDLDKCIKDDEISREAYEIIGALPETYWETSPSGTGLHGIFCVDRTFPNIATPETGVEVYCEKHFMSLTGQCVNGIGTIANAKPSDFDFLRKKAIRETKIANNTVIVEGSRTNTLLSIGGTMLRRGLNAESIEQAIRQYNSDHCSPPLDEKSIRAVIKSLAKYQAADSLLVQENKDVGNADRLLVWGQGNFRYVAAFNRWAVFDGNRWPVEDREQESIRSEAQAMVRAFCMQAAQKGDEKTIKFAADCLNTPRITNLLREAQPNATLLVADMDRDPLLVNFLNGTLDARTNKLREHRREDYITAVITHDYIPKAQCPKWERFIAETFDWDREMIEFVQRALGYSLTGDTSEKCVFLAHGPKDTAKTTLLATVKVLAGAYAGRIKVESLMVERGRPMDSNAQADLADLRGKRFIMTSETGQGQRLREELVKLLAQGQGDYRAVRKYENPFAFPETWKIWMDCNHLPVVHGTDDAIWERLIVIPFEHRVPKAKQNPALGRQLIATEAEGILAWLVRGLNMWRTDRLPLPTSMLAERKRWRKESDDLGQWLEEQCVVRPGAQTSSSTLYSVYKTWRATNGLYEESVVLFARKMKEHGFEKKEIGKNKCPTWMGVGVIGR